MNLLTQKPYIDVDLTLNFANKGQREDAIFDQLLQNLPVDNNRFYIEHDKETNTFTVKEYPDQLKKSHLITVIQAANNKIARSEIKKLLKEFKEVMKKQLNKLSEVEFANELKNG